MTIHEFIKKHGLNVATATMVKDNPNVSDPSWKADHWHLVIARPGHIMPTYYSMGTGHEGRRPRLAEVLDSLASDVSGIDQPFEDWARDLGYDPDSRKAEKIFAACKREAAELEKFLGPDAFAELLNDVERL